MDHLPIPEKPDVYKSIMDIMRAKIDKRMEKGNLFLILAVLLPLIDFACIPVISIVELAGFVLCELLLVGGVAWGTKQYHRIYGLPRQKYPVEMHIAVICLCGLGAGVMVVIPSRWYVMVAIWVVSLIVSLLCQLLHGERDNLWNEFAVAFAISIRAGYLIYLVVCLLIMAALVAVGRFF